MPSHVNPVVPAMSLDGYTAVTILKTATIADHEYRRGTRHMVDSVTLKSLEDAGLIAPGS